MAIANYGICVHCSELIENDSVMWRDIEGHSFSLTPLTGTGQFIYHVHAPMDEQTYKGHGKYDSLDAEILDSLAMEGYAPDSVGDQSTFGFFDLFPDYRVILTSHPDGSVTVTRFDNDETMMRIWDDIVSDYDQFSDDDIPCDCGAITYQCDCNNYNVYCDDGYDEYAYESGAYESDLWD